MEAWTALKGRGFLLSQSLLPMQREGDGMQETGMAEESSRSFLLCPFPGPANLACWT